MLDSMCLANVHKAITPTAIFWVGFVKYYTDAHTKTRTQVRHKKNTDARTPARKFAKRHTDKNKSSGATWY